MDHVHKYNLAAAVRACGITHMNGDPRDADWIAGRLLEELEKVTGSLDPCGQADCRRCYADPGRPEPAGPPETPGLPAVKAVAAALRSAGTVTLQGCASDRHGNAYGELMYPEPVAELIVAYLAQAGGLVIMPDKPGPFRVIPGPGPVRAADPEVAAITAIVAAMDTLDDLAAERVGNWLASRYGTA